MRFVGVTAPASNAPSVELEVEGARFDLRESLQFVGLTYGPEEGMATMGWSAAAEMQVRRGSERGALIGIELSWRRVSRFEVSFQPAPTAEDEAVRAGALEYFEFRHDPEATFVFFFENGTVRVSGGEMQGTVLLEPAERPIQ